MRSYACSIDIEPLPSAGEGADAVAVRSHRMGVDSSRSDPDHSPGMRSRPSAVERSRPGMVAGGRVDWPNGGAVAPLDTEPELTDGRSLPLHLIVILVIALLVIGPGKLPDTGAALGRAIREFRHAASGDDEPDASAGGPPDSTRVGK